MIKTLSLALLLAGTGLIAACGDSAGPDDDGDTATLVVMTRNLYVGTDVDAVILALRTEDPLDDIPALLNAITTLQRTDFPARAAAIADEIARVRPHAIGLQEVSEVDVALPVSGIAIQQDFLSTLLAELAERDLDYVPAAQVRNIEAAPFPGVTLVDSDVILVDESRVTVGATTAQNFSENLGEVAPGVSLVRGWVTARVTVSGTEITLASTHLESGSFEGLPELRASQAQELIESLDHDVPAVLMGDLNDIPGSPMYQAVTGAAFRDVWEALQPGVAGNTCCHLADLSNEAPALASRIDYIFARGLERLDAEVSGTVELLGESSADRIAGSMGSIWPSDHAGVAAELSLPNVLAGRVAGTSDLRYEEDLIRRVGG